VKRLFRTDAEAEDTKWELIFDEEKTREPGTSSMSAGRENVPTKAENLELGML